MALSAVVFDVGEANEIAYVGGRVDNDVRPALEAVAAVHVRRGPWGHLFAAPQPASVAHSLAELRGARHV